MKKISVFCLIVIFSLIGLQNVSASSLTYPIDIKGKSITFNIPVKAGDSVKVKQDGDVNSSESAVFINGIIPKPDYGWTVAFVREAIMLEDSDTITITGNGDPTSGYRNQVHELWVNGNLIDLGTVEVVDDIETTPTPEPTPVPTPEPTDPPEPTPTPEPTPEPTPTPPPPLTVSYQPNKTAIVVNIAGGQAPYQISWSHDGEELGSFTTSNSSYRIEGLLSETNYVITVVDDYSDLVVDVVNTGSFEGFIPPSFPSPGEVFQKMIDNFGVAGSIAIAVISAAIALGLIVILGMWGWRLAKKWLNAAK